jgi:hypothetical protein
VEERGGVLSNSCKWDFEKVRRGLKSAKWHVNILIIIKRGIKSEKLHGTKNYPGRALRTLLY